MAQTAAAYPPLNERPIKNTICLFDVDGTLSLARQVTVLPLMFHVLCASKGTASTFGLNPS